MASRQRVAQPGLGQAASRPCGRAPACGTRQDGAGPSYRTGATCSSKDVVISRHPHKYSRKAHACRAVAAPAPAAPADAASTGQYQSIPDIFARLAERYPDDLALRDPHHQDARDLTFKEVRQHSEEMAAGFAVLGVKAGHVVAQFSDNSSRWLLADQGIMLNGAINAVRSSQATAAELAGICNTSEAFSLVLQSPKVLDKLAPELGGLSQRPSFVVLLWEQATEEQKRAAGIPVYTFAEVQQKGSHALQAGRWRAAAQELRRDMVATLVFTSGTTSEPKAAALTHGNILYQVEQFPFFIEVARGETNLSLLPPWHIYERTASYYILSRGAKQVYSSVKRLKGDLKKVKPDYLVCVPLVLDTLHARVLAALGDSAMRAVAMWLIACAERRTQALRIVRGADIRQAFEASPSALSQLRARALVLLLALPALLAQALVFRKVRQEVPVQRAVVSGGGSLAPRLDTFFEAARIPVLNGWGLTETSPVVACRQSDGNGADSTDALRNVRGTVGVTIPGTDLRIADPDNLAREVSEGGEGVILVRGPGVFARYWNNEADTREAFHDGWYNTGDLGKRVPPGHRAAGQLVVTGRAKDTIVTAMGENVSPQPIEDAICCSRLVRQAMVVGQDKRVLGALVAIDDDAVEAHFEENGDYRKIADVPDRELNNILLAEAQRENDARTNKNHWEALGAVQVARTPFSIEKGTLTQTMKLVRRKVEQQYAPELESLMAQLR